MLNQVTIIGNVGREPETRTFDNGGKVSNFSVAVTEKWKTKQGEQKESTEWFNVVIQSEGLIGIVERYVKRGDKIYLQGKLKTRKYEKDGQERQAVELIVGAFGGSLVLLGNKGENNSTSSDDGYSSGFSGFNRPSGPKESYDLNDDIPF